MSELEPTRTYSNHPANDILRRMLDERGVEYTEDLGYREFFWDFGEHGKARASIIGTRGLVQMIVTGITPEQAIAATLGSCNCSSNCTNGERTETCHITRQFTCSECGYQYPTRNYETYETCDGRTAYAPLGHYVLDWKKPNYCPNCGRRIEQ